MPNVDKIIDRDWGNTTFDIFDVLDAMHKHPGHPEEHHRKQVVLYLEALLTKIRDEDAAIPTVVKTKDPNVWGGYRFTIEPNEDIKEWEGENL